jgi:hypothetical protein
MRFSIEEQLAECKPPSLVDLTGLEASTLWGGVSPSTGLRASKP